MDNLVLQMENNNLKSRLKDEKKKKTGKRQLKAPFNTSADGGAMFYTPKAVQKARDYYSEKDQRAEQLRIERAEKKARQEAEKLEKQQKKDIRAKRRAEDKAEKQRLKDEEKVSKQANQQLQNDPKQATRSRKKQPPIVIEEDIEIDEESIVEVARAAPRVNTRGRKIVVPARFLD
ncbi:hypothetical protein K469DRAFT_703299 [Zopfia rhizophila CBS 207.26]|uniref:Uncharacterized protein n=1 Tax=Zopfia rhizophila CBS 207.26 TaxID=1314779 RepID=A0A6A6EDQ7_9PEZI|nr:hypothetical protein K469DRAFT_703299 [Zopfia rhizophila CBS 207.26]